MIEKYKGVIMQKDPDFEKSIKMAGWGVCDCDDGLDIQTGIKESRECKIYKPKIVWYKKIWFSIRNIFRRCLAFFRRKKEQPFSETTVSKVTDNKLQQISRLVLSSKSGNMIPVNMVRNKKTGVVVVFPCNADTLRSVYGDKADDYEVVESKIK